SNCVAGMAFGGQSDLSLLRELDGIAQQVEQDLFEPAFIADRFPEVRRELDTHCEALFVHLRRDERERLLDGAADLERLACNDELLGFDLRDIEHVVDERKQMSR